MSQPSSLADPHYPFRLTRSAAEKAFAEWERRSRETPEAFLNDFEKAALGLDTYGEQAAAYFFQLFLELDPANAAPPDAP